MAPPEPISLALSIFPLILSIEKICHQLQFVRDVVRGADDLSQSLDQLRDVLRSIHDEYIQAPDFSNSQPRNIRTLQKCINGLEYIVCAMKLMVMFRTSPMKGTRTFWAWWGRGAFASLTLSTVPRFKNSRWDTRTVKGPLLLSEQQKWS